MSEITGKGLISLLLISVLFSCIDFRRCLFYSVKKILNFHLCNNIENSCMNFRFISGNSSCSFECPVSRKIFSRISLLFAKFHGYSARFRSLKVFLKIAFWLTLQIIIPPSSPQTFQPDIYRICQ